MKAKSKVTVRAEQAIAKSNDAAFAECAEPGSLYPSEVVWARANAEMARNEAIELLEPGELVSGAGEIVPADTGMREKSWIIDTLQHPNSISVAASQQRMVLAEHCEVLPSAVDAAFSAGASNSLEKMLCHQMAAAHNLAMKLMARGANDRLPPVETARLLNTAVRLMETYQTGFTTLHRTRTGGRQTVVVQHVQVTDGGQAVIAGNMKTGGTRGGEGGGNGA